MNTLNLQPTVQTSAFGAPTIAPVPASRRPLELSDQRPRLSTLVSVELRKMSDTRSGRALMIALAALTVLIPVIELVVLAAGGTDQLSFKPLFVDASQGAVLLLPIIVMLVVTSEWSQRAGLSTFSLVPNRGRVIGAKLIAAMVATLAAFAFALAAAAVANPLSGAIGNSAVVWNLSVQEASIQLLTIAFEVLLAFGFATVFLNSAAALCSYFAFQIVMPLAMLGLMMLRSLASASEWIDPWYGIAAIRNDPTSVSNWAHLAVNALIWIALPLAIGVRRILRTEIK